MDAAAELARFLAKLKYEDLSAEAVAMAKADTLDTLDTIGVAASARPLEPAQVQRLISTARNLEQVDDAGDLARLTVAAESAVGRR